LTPYSYQRRLNWSECDPAGIIFFPHYAAWAVDGLNQMLQSGGYAPNRSLANGEAEGIPCVEFNMRFFDAPRLYSIVQHDISIRRIGTTSFTAFHRFSADGVTFAEALDTRVWSVHGKDGLRKSPLPGEVIRIFNERTESAEPK
jgi:4-hydroxybenzoyl-CoA thioesterase